MNRRAITLAISGALILGAVGAGGAQAAGPAREGDAYTVRFFDDFIFELCGIETWTTLTERWTFKAYPDGSATFHGVRTFVPDDPRIPIEKGAGTSHIAPDGSRVVTGRPTLLLSQSGGPKILIDAGRAMLDRDDNLISFHGQGVSLVVDDLAPYYCPQG